MKRIIGILIGLLVVGAIGFSIVKNHGFSIGAGDTQAKKPSSIAGLDCDNSQRRPIAVMLESDIEGRPLTSIGQADLVIEMPVTPNGITRFMVVFQCQNPKEIGAIRSAREDFIPLATSFQSLYAHWGGEHGSLDE